MDILHRTKDKDAGQAEDVVDIPEVERLEPVHERGLQRVFGALRLVLGFTFLWAFLDKAFGLGFATGRLEDGTIDFFAKGAAWFNGGSPTEGVFAFALKGPFKGFYEAVGGVEMTAQGPVATGNGWIDVVYMASMLLIGLGLITGVMTRLAAAGGIVWMAIFYTATSIWPENNPFVDDHIVEILVLVALILANAGRYYGLGKIWQRIPYVKAHPVLH